ncbi:hypothetical protein FB45DRAFT_1020656 [Roridomyces roridus]|uniref:Ricin B lectin domain-containing protein n=1 Tax=Roridomyces roridus TaxID=1738132 RepID=A0AAD7CAH0_9AGAR|nr:hypothetical protein FB45DRAFT_1020656 [Roridomyces roridus]
MKFILALTTALVSATMVAGAAAPAPAVPGFTNINDFQGSALNLVDDGVVTAGEGTAVTGLPVSFNTEINQGWTLIPQGTNFTIANGLNSTLKLSYPTARFGGNPHFSGLIVSGEFPATFSLQTSGKGVRYEHGFLRELDMNLWSRIVEVTSGHTLTSWATAGGQLESPVTLYPVTPGLQTQQTWTLVASSCPTVPPCSQLIAFAVAGIALAQVAVAVVIPADLVNIVDYQGCSLNLVGGNEHDVTAVIVYPSQCNDQLNQQWSFVPHVGPNFTVVNGLRPSLQLSYPSAPVVNGNPLFSALVVYSKSPANFTLQDAGNGGFYIIEANSKQALTSWAAVSAQPETPVTLAPLKIGLQRQQTWNITAAPSKA